MALNAQGCSTLASGEWRVLTQILPPPLVPLLKPLLAILAGLQSFPEFMQDRANPASDVVPLGRADDIRHPNRDGKERPGNSRPTHEGEHRKNPQHRHRV